MKQSHYLLKFMAFITNFINKQALNNVYLTNTTDFVNIHTNLNCFLALIYLDIMKFLLV